MIITTEIVNRLKICAYGYNLTMEAAEKNNWFYGNSVQESVELLHKLGYPVLAEWVLSHVGTLIEASGEGIYSNLFRVQHFDTQTYTEFTDLQSAQQQLASNKQQFLDQNSQSFAVNRVVYDEQGNATWTPVDINSVTEEGHFNVSDPTTGVNELCTTLAEAKILSKQVQDKFLNLHKAKFILEQKISHPDGDIGWTDTLSQQ